MSAASVRLRFFASARTATGSDDLDVPATATMTIDDALGQTPGGPDAARVLSRCSFLVNGVATTDRSTRLSAGDLVDVMPPFAGG